MYICPILESVVEYRRENFTQNAYQRDAPIFVRVVNRSLLMQLYNNGFGP